MKTGNTRRDVGSYERSGYERGTPLYDGNVLYAAFLRARKGSSWKESVQRMETNLLPILARLRRGLRERTYEFKPPISFALHERGRTRRISGDHIEDRTVKHALCDCVLMPAVRPYLIYDNGVSLPGKGVSFTRERLITHLCRYYREHGSNQGYILLGDCSKYYDNLRHDIVMESYRRYTTDDLALWLVQRILDNCAPDVSYLTDEEYARSMDTIFNRLEHERRKDENQSGEKILRKGMDIGDQVSMVSGIAYTIPLDNYIKIVCGEKYYGRYQDDFYVISDSKEHLQQLLRDITERAGKLGVTISQKKTRISALSDPWRFMQIQYALQPSGRIMRKINPRSLTRFRRHLRGLAQYVDQEEFRETFFCWYRSYRDIMSRKQRQNLMKLYEQLEESICIQSDSATDPS